MYYELFKLFCNQTYYVVVEEGWYYNCVNKVFTTKQDAINHWEALTGLSYSSEIYSQYAKPKDMEGFEYWGIREIKGKDIADFIIKETIADTIGKEAQAIKDKAEKFIQSETNYRVKEKTKEMIKLLESTLDNNNKMK